MNLSSFSPEKSHNPINRLNAAADGSAGSLPSYQISNDSQTINAGDVGAGAGARAGRGTGGPWLSKDTRYVPTVQERTVINEANRTFLLTYLSGITSGLTFGYLVSRVALTSPSTQWARGMTIFGFSMTGEYVGRKIGEGQAKKVLMHRLAPDSELRKLIATSQPGFSVNQPVQFPQTPTRVSHDHGLEGSMPAPSPNVPEAPGLLSRFPPPPYTKEQQQQQQRKPLPPVLPDELDSWPEDSTISVSSTSLVNKSATTTGTAPPPASTATTATTTQTPVATATSWSKIRQAQTGEGSAWDRVRAGKPLPALQQQQSGSVWDEPEDELH